MIVGCFVGNFVFVCGFDKSTSSNLVVSVVVLVCDFNELMSSNALMLSILLLVLLFLPKLLFVRGQSSLIVMLVVEPGAGK